MKHRFLILGALLFSLSLPATAAQVRFEASCKPFTSQDPVQLQWVRLKNQQTLLQAALAELEKLPELRIYLLTQYELEGLTLHASRLQHANQPASDKMSPQMCSHLILDTQRIKNYFLQTDQESPLLEAYTLLRSQQDAFMQAVEKRTATSLSPDLQGQVEMLQFLELGLRAYEQQQWILARDRFSAVLKRNPKLAEVYNIRGRVWLLLAQPLNALRDFEQAIKRAPQLASAHFHRGYVYSLEQKPRLALQAFNQAIARNGHNALYYNNRGTVHNQLGEFKLALEDFNRAIALRNQEASYYRNRAKTWVFLNSPGQAITDYDTAIALAPRNAQYLLERGQLKAAQKDLKGALHDYTKALFLEPENAQALFLRARVYAQMNIHHLAISDYTRGLAITPDPTYFAERGRLYGLHGDQRRRIQDFTVVIQKAPQHVEAWFERGLGYLYSRQPTQALSDFEQGFKRAQRAGKLKPEYYFYRGLALRELKRCPTALQDFEKACRMGLSEACTHGCGSQPSVLASKSQTHADTSPNETLHAVTAASKSDSPSELGAQPSTSPSPGKQSQNGEHISPPPAADPEK